MKEPSLTFCVIVGSFIIYSVANVKSVSIFPVICVSFNDDPVNHFEKSTLSGD